LNVNNPTNENIIVEEEEEQHKKPNPIVRVLDTRQRKATAFGFLLYYPLVSLLVGGPIPFPSLIDVSSAHVAFINFLSLLVTLVGSIIGIGFYVERRNNLKFDAQNHKMDHIDKKIDQKGDWLYKEMREMEQRLCSNINDKFKTLERDTEYKVSKARDIEDERFRRIDEAHREHERRLDRIDNTSYRDYTHNRDRRIDDRQKWDNEQ